MTDRKQHIKDLVRKAANAADSGDAIMTDMRQHIKDLVGKAANATDSGDAMKFSQAACNAANALATLTSTAE